MKEVPLAIFASVRAGFRSRAALRSSCSLPFATSSPSIGGATRVHTKLLLWASLSRTWTGWRDILGFVQPSTASPSSAAGATSRSLPQADRRQERPRIGRDHIVNILIVLAHPDPGSFNHALAGAAAQAAKRSGHDVVLHDLYAERFDPILPSGRLLEERRCRPGYGAIARTSPRRRGSSSSTRTGGVSLPPS